MTLERARRFVREGLGRTAVAYAIPVVTLLLTGLAFYYLRQNVEARERARFEEITAALRLTAASAGGTS